MARLRIKSLCMAVTVEVKSVHITVRKLKDLFHDREGVAPEMQRYIFDMRVLDDQRSLSDYNIQDGDTIWLVILV